MAVRRTKRAYVRTPKQPPNPAVQEFAAVEAVTAAAPEQSAPQAAPASAPRQEMRSEMRAPMRTSAEEAAIRAAQIFADVDLDAEDDKFALPPNLAPEGWEYEWKAHEIIGKRNPGNEVQLARMGWDPVDTSRHPEMMPQGYTGAITREGMMLMQRPKVVNDRQRQAAYAKAVGQVRNQDLQVGIAPKDTGPRDNKGSPMARVSREFVSPAALASEGFTAVAIPE